VRNRGKFFVDRPEPSRDVARNIQDHNRVLFRMMLKEMVQIDAS
jgi:hypothetical protein